MAGFEVDKRCPVDSRYFESFNCCGSTGKGLVDVLPKHSLFMFLVFVKVLVYIIFYSKLCANLCSVLNEFITFLTVDLCSSSVDWWDGHIEMLETCTI